MKLREVQIPQITEVMEQYIINWNEHVHRMCCHKIKERNLNTNQKEK
jgi:hypothetical protein